MSKWPTTVAMTAREGVIGAALVSVVLSGLAIGQHVPRLPEPAGRYGIGRLAFESVDPKRLDPFPPDRKEFRRVMVYLWYPTGADQKADKGVYWPGAKRIDAAPGFDRSRFGSVWPLIVSGAITSHARDNAVPATDHATWPVVVFSHGNSTTSFSYTTAIEDLVSHGYVVAAVEHPYIAAAVAFPSGSVAVYVDRSSRPSGVSYFEGVELAMREMRQSGGIQAADLSFASDQLAALNNSKSSLLNGRLDLSHVAVVGHSLGGQAAVRACQTDARFKACVDLDGGTPDGAFLQYADARPLKQPLLYVEATPPPTFTDQQLAQRGVSRTDWDLNLKKVTDRQEQQLRSGLGGSYKAVLRAPGVNHFTFTDVSLNATTPAAENRALHNVKLTTEVTRAFLDKVLKGESSSLLDANAPANPELLVTRYAPVRR